MSLYILCTRYMLAQGDVTSSCSKATTLPHRCSHIWVDGTRDWFMEVPGLSSVESATFLFCIAKLHPNQIAARTVHVPLHSGSLYLFRKLLSHIKISKTLHKIQGWVGCSCSMCVSRTLHTSVRRSSMGEIGSEHTTHLMITPGKACHLPKMDRDNRNIQKKTEVKKK